MMTHQHLKRSFNAWIEKLSSQKFCLYHTTCGHKFQTGHTHRPSASLTSHCSKMEQKAGLEARQSNLRMRGLTARRRDLEFENVQLRGDLNEAKHMIQALKWELQSMLPIQGSDVDSVSSDDDIVKAGTQSKKLFQLAEQNDCLFKGEGRHNRKRRLINLLRNRCLD
jgi:hypothetical protein